MAKEVSEARNDERRERRSTKIRKTYEDSWMYMDEEESIRK